MSMCVKDRECVCEVSFRQQDISSSVYHHQLISYRYIPCLAGDEGDVGLMGDVIDAELLGQGLVRETYHTEAVYGRR